MATFTEKKKKERRLLLILGGVVVTIMLVLVAGLPGGEEEALNLLEGSVKQTAEQITQDISIPRDIFKEGRLDDFEFYTPLQLPQEHGRDNPFAPLES
ncbi:MAG: hypothetical protein A2932_00475 [Candidatus Spechtbacteria bacterium RIFCSPLOWO2_01_FULL_46_10]|uniref:Uncharacterized protein n=1 Tax=Candidatus Spechtbacteria bacterium RIFCSPLOWO2_01_FULL_46_10 TaxID=1802163 RepID=A0A1G2HHL2_9BACT|nr:MAG: hypothetical protein A2932_00475 [Candidatus Spechtbacteria bacterium RIFCSPLOWO2_01_FULL_46_10]